MAVHWQSLPMRLAMSRQKNETLTIRTTAEIKDLLRQAAEREHRSLASMIEVLVMDYAKKAKLQPSASAQSTEH